MRVLGLDPGLSGAVALIDTALDLVLVQDMPVAKTSNKSEVVSVWLARMIANWSPDVAWVEQVHSMPRQGVASVFSFGVSYGIARGVLAGLGVATYLTPPHEWKRRLRLTQDKNASRAMAATYYPQYAHQFARVRDDGRAEAVLLAHYGLHHAQTQHKM